jgi:hypothetical protein
MSYAHHLAPTLAPIQAEASIKRDCLEARCLSRKYKNSGNPSEGPTQQVAKGGHPLAGHTYSSTLNVSEDDQNKGRNDNVQPGEEGERLLQNGRDHQDRRKSMVCYPLAKCGKGEERTSKTSKEIKASHVQYSVSVGDRNRG